MVQGGFRGLRMVKMIAGLASLRGGGQDRWHEGESCAITLFVDGYKHKVLA
jgi:hypothetical protein